MITDILLRVGRRTRERHTLHACKGRWESGACLAELMGTHRQGRWVADRRVNDRATNFNNLTVLPEPVLTIEERNF